MNETDKETEQSGVKVRDRRRFEPDGTPRVEEDQPSTVKEGAAAPQEGASPAEESREAMPEAAAQPSAQDLELQRLRGELDASRKRVDELARAYQALHAEREEFKARLSRERERMMDVEKGNVALALLEAIDQLELATNSVPNDDSPLARGVRLIRDGLVQQAQGMGIERLSLVGQMFDPNLADAADMEITAEEADDQRVVAEVRPGYRLKGRVIRPARVKVAKYVKPADA